MSGWTHPQCEACWIAREAIVIRPGLIAIRRPARITQPEAARCCYCGKLTISGIFRRDDPARLSHCIGHEDRTPDQREAVD